MPSPQWTTLLDPEAVGLKGMDLLLRHQSHGLLLGDLLSVDADRRNWTIAARDFLKRGDFVAAARCARQTTDPAVTEEIEAAYQSRRKQYQQKVEELYRQARESERVVKELQELTDAREYLEIAAESLEKLPLQRPGVVVQLATLGNHALSDFDEACTEAEILLQKAQKEALSRQEKQKGEIRRLSKQINQQIDELLLDEIQTDVVQRLGERARNALLRRDIDQLLQVHRLLGQVQSGQSLGDDEFVDAQGSGSDPGLAPAARLLGSSQSGSIVDKATAERISPRPRLADLSMLVQQDLERAQNNGSTLPELPSIEPLDFERRGLEQQYAHVKPLAANEDTKAMSQYLLCWAKLNLLDRKYDRALTLFCDALRWQNLDESDHRARNVAMWGLLLSLSVPYLPSEEQQRSVNPKNLVLLCEKKIGDFPLLRIEQMGLIADLARQLLRLAWPTAVQIVRLYLLSYFGMRTVAAAEFTAELSEAVTTHPACALHLLALLYEDQIPDGQLSSDLRQLATNIGSQLSDAPSRRIFCVNLREKLLPFADDWELIASVTEALQAQIQRLGQKSSSTQSRWKISHDLLTPDVPLIGGSRLVIRLKSDGPTPLRGVTTVARLLTEPRVDATSFPGVLEPLEPIACIEPGRSYERTIGLLRADDELCTSLTLELQHSVHSEEGVVHPLESPKRYFTIRFVPPTKEATRPTNPYTFGLPITTPNSIYGRETTINQICDALIGRDRDNAVLILGDRKIGKTTLLTALREHQRIQSRYQTLYIDLEKIPDRCERTAFYYQYLIQPIQRKLRELDLPMLNCSEASLQRAPESVFEDFFRQADRLLQGKNQRLLLILDEFERVIALIDRADSGTGPDQGFGPEVLAALRAVLQSARCISLILSSVKYMLRRRTVHPNDRLSRLGVEIELAPLDENGAQLLVKLPPRGQYDVTATAVDVILQETARQPYLIQKLCHQLFNEMANSHSRLASAADVQRILETMARDAGGFVHLIEPIQSASDYRLIQALAVLQSGRSWVRMKDLLRQLRRESGRPDEDVVRARLTDLADQVPSVVERHPVSPYQFRITVGLFARFLRQQPESRAPFYIPTKA